MKIITDINEANNLLQSYIGADAQVAFYSESLRRISIRIWLNRVDEVIYLVGVGCLSMNGLFSFSDANLFIVKEEDENTNESITKISDRTSGFELNTNGGFSMVQGLLSEFGHSFDNFILDDD
jgi:hypothetical protein